MQSQLHLRCCSAQREHKRDQMVVTSSIILWEFRITSEQRASHAQKQVLRLQEKNSVRVFGLREPSAITQKYEGTCAKM